MHICTHGYPRASRLCPQHACAVPSAWHLRTPVVFRCDICILCCSSTSCRRPASMPRPRCWCRGWPRIPLMNIGCMCVCAYVHLCVRVCVCVCRKKIHTHAHTYNACMYTKRRGRAAHSNGHKHFNIPMHNICRAQGTYQYIAARRRAALDEKLDVQFAWLVKHRRSY